MEAQLHALIKTKKAVTVYYRTFRSMCYFVEWIFVHINTNEITVMLKINGTVILNIEQNDVFLF